MKEKAFAVIILFLVSLAFVTPVQSRPKVYDWIDKSPTTAPAARSDVEMVYDSANEVVVLFGGGGYWTQRWNWFGDTWTYNVKTNTWTNMNPTDAPCARTYHGMAYDSDNEVVVLFGGVDNSGTLLDDTWTYDVKTNTWTNMNPTDAPSPRHGIAMAYDSKNKKVVMHGEPYFFSEKPETWTYDVSANTWTNMEPAASPPPYSPTTLVYDSANKVMVTLCYTDVWTYSLDTNTWTKREPATKPPDRWNGPQALAYDSHNNRMILFGGLWWVDTIALPRDDTWAYDVKKNTWTDISPSVSPRGSIAHGIIYDSKNKVVVMFGGDTGWYGPNTDDTWVYTQIKPS